MLAQIISRYNHVAWASVRETMCASRLQRPTHLLSASIHQQGPDGFNRPQSHSGRGACRKNAKDQLFPKTKIRTTVPNFAELSNTVSDFFASRLMNGANSFNSDRLMIALHSDLSILRFYESVKNIVNAFVSAANKKLFL